MRYARQTLFGLALAALTNGVPLSMLLAAARGGGRGLSAWWLAALAAAFFYLNLRPLPGRLPTRRLRQLAAGCALLQFFAVGCAAALVLQPLWLWGLLSGRLPAPADGWGAALLAAEDLALLALPLCILFWNGMIRVYLTSVQLGIRHRVLAAVCGWVPFLNLWYLAKIVRICKNEVEFETEKWWLDNTRAESCLCGTKYPLLLVHGVFFRDFRYLNYWGRIPRALAANGATVYYGQQQSAASVEQSGRELAARIRQIVQETGCEKVNIIAHSKGGLDSRAAISHCGMAPYVATLTTINTPHRGCLFAEYLLDRLPRALQRRIAAGYNAALRRLGDPDPDFMAAVTDLTQTACLARNAATPDAAGVVYESVMSCCRKARYGRFPLNLTYPLVRRFDGPNDGLVSVESAGWGGRFTLLEPPGRRGITHGDMIDLNRENIPGFDVREFYVKLAAGLKARGF